MMEHGSGSDVPVESTATGREGSPGRRLWVAALLGALLASVLSWAAGEATAGLFRPKEVGNPLAEQADVVGYNRVMVKNATLSSGLQGALLGLTLGLAGGAARRAARPTWSAGLAGLIVGGALGAAGSFGLFTAYFATTDTSNPDLIASLAVHAGVGALLGIGGGLAFGLGTGHRGWAWRAALGGLIGAVLGAGVYEVAGAVLFPVDRTGDPVAASGVARLLWHALVALSAGFGAVALLDSNSKKPAKARPAGEASIS